MAWLALNPLLVTLVPVETIVNQLIKLGYLADINTAGGPGGWNPDIKSFDNPEIALYRAFIRQIGAGAVTAGGLILSLIHILSRRTDLAIRFSHLLTITILRVTSSPGGI